MFEGKNWCSSSIAKRWTCSGYVRCSKHFRRIYLICILHCKIWQRFAFQRCPRRRRRRERSCSTTMCGVCDSRGMSSTVFSCQESARGSGQKYNYTVLCDDDVNAWWSRDWWKMWYFSWKYVVKFSEWLQWLKPCERWISGCTWKIIKIITIKV